MLSTYERETEREELSANKKVLSEHRQDERVKHKKHKGQRFDIDRGIWDELKLAVKDLKSFRSLNAVANNRDD